MCGCNSLVSGAGDERAAMCGEHGGGRGSGRGAQIDQISSEGAKANREVLGLRRVLAGVLPAW